ncbi:O-antigen ligase family protein [Pseudochrobactrum sp. sp1633]|uniref:O-antigen ligase family protein n=1 Tax=Pseudochrobactrum sp. sp1633 TaxID=3036706 RepID=UPI0025A5ABC9|nr:O-antigen ligase family protein [Pseudochrobactrum sp. sp1633]MDM8345249.1 O-antigen ligase family protein [Pseudochrobactrum sp. sp1633]HWD12900.1 O-antigen ligase family protein [Pseudochrobactrum sp.]
MRILQKNFLIRRRVDLWLLFIAAAAMPVRLPLGPLILFIFSCIGVYLALCKNRFHRFYGAHFYLLISAYMIWSLGLMAWRGELDAANRQVGYVLLLWLYSFGGLGMVLVRDPVRILAFGSRIGLIICATAVAGEELFLGGRIGVGGNPAVFAYAAAITAVAATLPIKKPPFLLPNGPWYLIIGTGVVFASETRAVMLTLALLAIFEIVVLIGRIASHKVKIGSSLMLAACLTAVFTVGPVASVLSQRFSGMMHYYETGDSSQWSDKSSADTREQMWRGAAKVVSEHPLTGVGSDQKMTAVREALGDQATLLDGYIHVHNSVLDELLVNGAVGFLLLLAAALCGFVFLWRNNSDCAIRRVLIYFTITWGSYAMLHNPLLHETSIAVTMFFFSAVYAGTSRNLLRQSSGAENALDFYNRRPVRELAFPAGVKG